MGNGTRIRHSKTPESSSSPVALAMSCAGPKTLRRRILSDQRSGGPKRMDKSLLLFCLSVLLQHVLDTDAIVRSAGQEGKLELLTLELEDWEGGPKKPENASEITEKTELKRAIP